MNDSEVEEHRIESGEEFLLITAKVSLVFVSYCSLTTAEEPLEFEMPVE